MPPRPGPAHAHAWHPSLHLSSISISKRATYRRRSTKGRERGRYVKNCQNVSLSLSLLGLFLAAGCSSGRKHENALSLLGEGRRRKKDRGERERTRRNIKKEVEIGSLSGREEGRKKSANELSGKHRARLHGRTEDLIIAPSSFSMCVSVSTYLEKTCFVVWISGLFIKNTDHSEYVWLCMHSSHTMLPLFSGRKSRSLAATTPPPSHICMFTQMGKLRDSAKSGLKMINKKGLARSTNFSLPFSSSSSSSSSSSLPLFSPGTGAQPNFTFSTNCQYNSE